MMYAHKTAANLEQQSYMPRNRRKSEINIEHEDKRNDKVQISDARSLLRIEPFIPKLPTRSRAPLCRSFSTLSSSYVRKEKLRTLKHPAESNGGKGSNRSNFNKPNKHESCNILRSTGQQTKFPDRLCYDRRGLTSIPFIENEQSVRVLSLQHNLINHLHVPSSNYLILDDKNSKCRTTYGTEKEVQNVAARHDSNNKIVRKPSVGSNSTSNVPSQSNQMSVVTLTEENNSPLEYLHRGNSNNYLTGCCNVAKLKIQNMVTKGFNQKSTQMQAHIISNSIHRSKSFSNFTDHHSLMKFNTKRNVLSKTVKNNRRNNIRCSVVNVQNIRSDILQIVNDNYSNVSKQVVEVDHANSVCGYMFQNLVYLDLYNNQIEKISNLDGCKNLAVLLLGKNRISDISGLISLKNTLQILDLHNNKISNVSNTINCLQELKTLNLAGNQIQQIRQNDFAGLLNLKELNLKNNRIKELSGFSHLNSLERLWLCNNDLQTVEDISSIAEAVNLRDVTIENNPVALAGDCVSFLVSYLPNLASLSQMPITEQVRRAAKAWRTNKEKSDVTYINLTSDIYNSMRRQQVISNARTSWELLRSQHVLGMSGNGISKISSSINLETCTKEVDQTFKLPTILQLYSNSSDRSQSSGSSLGPNIDSASSCSTDEDDNYKYILTQSAAMQTNQELHSDAEECVCEPMKPNVFTKVVVIEELEPVTTNTVQQFEPVVSCEMKDANIKSSWADNENGNTITSILTEFEVSASSLTRENSQVVKAKASIPAFAKRCLQGSRTQMSKGRMQVFNQKYNANKLNKPFEREREQGGDYLIEICGRYLNMYGLGALRFIDKQWNPQKANDVNTLNFSYINFNNITTILGRVKSRFPIAECFVFRETNVSKIGQLNALAELQGITSLEVNQEGNSIYNKRWRPYAIFRLSHWGLKCINGKDVTTSEVDAAQCEFASLSDLVIWSLPECMVQPLLERIHFTDICTINKLSYKEWLLKADRTLKYVVSKEALQWRKPNNSENDIARENACQDIASMIENMFNAVQKLQKLETLWTSILVEIVRDTLIDYSQFEVYIKNSVINVMKNGK